MTKEFERSYRYSLKVVSFILFIATLVSCETHKESVDRKSQSRKVLRINLDENISSLDPSSLSTSSDLFVCKLIYEGLFSKNTVGTVQTTLLESVTYDSASKSYLFSLSPLKKYSNGTNVSTKEVYRRFKELIDSEKESPLINSFRDPIAGYKRYSIRKKYRVLKDSLPSGFHIIDDKQFSLEWNGSIEQLSEILSTPEFWIYEKDSSINQILGSGPYVVEYANEDISYSLKRNAHYKEIGSSEKLPYLDGISIRFIKDSEAKISEFLNGSLDIIEFETGWNVTKRERERLGTLGLDKYGSHKAIESNVISVLCLVVRNVYNQNLQEMIRLSIDSTSINNSDSLEYFATRFFYPGSFSKIPLPIVVNCPTGCSSLLKKVSSQLQGYFAPIITRTDRVNPKSPYLVLEERKIIIEGQDYQAELSKALKNQYDKEQSSLVFTLQHKPVYIFSDVMLEGIHSYSDWSRSIPYIRFKEPRVLSGKR